MRAQSMEFCELNVEFGYAYDSAAVVDGRQRAAGARRSDPRVRAVDPPGLAAPHAWIDDQEEAARPIKDLVRPGRFLLIAGEDGADVV